MTTRRLIERIEGEATIDFHFKSGVIDDAFIRFEHMRGMETIMKSRPAMDALVLSPRVCGICGHAHLMATVRGIEAAYEQAGFPVELTSKARHIREITLMLELIQNHLKWFYLVIVPAIYALSGESASANMTLKGAYGASIANKAAALFSGQWPHSSYAIPGGVTCDPTHLEVMQVQQSVDELTGMVERELLGISLDAFRSMATCKAFNALHSDLAGVEQRLIARNMHKVGHAFDRFIILGDHDYANAAKYHATVRRLVDPERISTESPHLIDGSSVAKNVLYKGKHFEVGPLARAISMDYALIKNMHRRFKDAAYTRIMARMYELSVLLQRVRERVQTLDLSEPSYIAPAVPIKTLSGEGTGIVEAPRGPLIHRIRIEAGVMTDYGMITPTQWNLGSGPAENRGIAQQAMIGLSNEKSAEFVFRSFDVCSVCTTH